MRPSLAFTAHYSRLTAARGGSHFFSLFYVSNNFKTQLFSKIDGHFLGASCFVIANLGRLVAAKMRISINCIEFAYSRLIDYPRPCKRGECSRDKGTSDLRRDSAGRFGKQSLDDEGGQLNQKCLSKYGDTKLHCKRNFSNDF